MAVRSPQSIAQLYRLACDLAVRNLVPSARTHCVVQTIRIGAVELDPLGLLILVTLRTKPLGKLFYCATTGLAETVVSEVGISTYTILWNGAHTLIFDTKRAMASRFVFLVIVSNTVAESLRQSSVHVLSLIFG